jgi:hypothetical protein
MRPVNVHLSPAAGGSIVSRFWPLTALALVVGCTPADEIETYDAPRSEPRLRAVDAAAEYDRLDHMFAGIVPHGGKAWFFKLVVPGSAADKFKEPFTRFIASVDAGGAAAAPKWTLPEGWTERPAEGLRAATIEIPHDGATLELAVSSLPLGGDWDEFLKQNVDRWMGQLQEDPLPLDVIRKLAKTVPTTSGDATVLELVGEMQTSGMGAGAMAGGELPAGHPPVDASRAESPPAAAAGTAELSYETPGGWQPAPLGTMRKASFRVVRDGGNAEVSVTKFPVVQDMADPRANALRWAGPGQAELTNVTDEDIDKARSDVEIGGLAGTRFEFLAHESTPQAQGVIAAMAVDGDEVWFFKILGDRAVVESEREAFDKWIASVRFTHR